ncbi:hypothetical protein G647_06548 [Cladophialophora carrionii CBS 160.54]|uniref:Uncharacterized protein n=1 Tax=Cladophialophora carrionii CBS 160.54 TaxID=1279043 RepID=V9D853_9EURO|nr:uncharacterized protein G647_06548 [Cladophialophora carrionii CBS 160.54]ETI22473.1 hypothetical protein G647_06548 [Cladophialophora carrionii CBS 160.54]
MTSLIFGGIYMGHKGIVNHRREKQRQKNYERWEGLRDEYDEQRKITRASRSLDIQRTGDYDPDKPILTLRDQQEANDARTSWRPQEAWDDSPRRTSVEVTSGSGLRPLATNKTGATWDEGLPQPLKVSRRNWEDYAPPVSRSSSLRKASTPTSPPQDTSSNSSNNTPSMSNRPSPRLDAPTPTTHLSHPHSSRSVTTPLETMHHETVEPIEYSRPGGLMAELIEGADSHRPAPYTHQSPQTYTGYPAQNYYPPAPAPATAIATAPAPYDGSMQEWWNRPLN